MTILTRLIEKLTGRAHQKQNLAMVSQVATDLSRDVDDLTDKLKPYTQADDPLVALMTDVFNDRQAKRQLAQLKKTNGDAAQ
jgi:hypothetical protein